MSGGKLLILGLGYSGRAVAAAAMAAGLPTVGTSREPAAAAPAPCPVIAFDEAGPAIAEATHLLATAAPGEGGDPVLARYAAAIAAAPLLTWIGYFSTTGVYGDRRGGWVDEDAPPAPAQPRAIRRVAAEAAWGALAGRRAVDLFRLAGIYGPGRSLLDDVRAGTARRVIAPGHTFGRIHRDDIAAAVLAAIAQQPPPGVRVFNLSDDAPAESAAVTAEAARLLGVPPPPEVPFAAAWERMGPMARGFWAEDRKVSSAKTRARLGIAWRYPSYREGLAAILDEERAEQRGERPA